MQCDSVEIEIPEEYDYRCSEETLPHNTAEHTEWKLSGDLPPEVAEDPEPEDDMLQKGLRGAIVFTSSASAYIPNPFAITYGATKAYMSQFAASIAVEGIPMDVADIRRELIRRDCR